MKLRIVTLAAVVGFSLLPVSALAQDGDPTKGERVFRKCGACHTLEEGQHRVGPSLAGLWGRTSGTVDGYPRYSPAMKDAAVVWGPETLDAYIADPKGYIPGNRMPFPGLRKADERADLIAYFNQQFGD